MVPQTVEAFQKTKPGVMETDSVAGNAVVVGGILMPSIEDSSGARDPIVPIIVQTAVSV